MMDMDTENKDRLARQKAMLKALQGGGERGHAYSPF